MTAAEPVIALDATRRYLDELAAAHGPLESNLPAARVVVAAALVHLDRLAAQVVELEARVESLLAHEVRVADEWGTV